MLSLNGKMIEGMDALTYWLLNVSSAFMLSAAHNVLYFVLDWRTPLLHFLHHLCTLLYLLLKLALFSPSSRPLLVRLPSAIARPPLRTLLWRPVVAQLAVMLLTTCVHSQHRTGALYLVRIFDFLGSLFVIRFASNFVPTSAKEEPRRRKAICSLLMPLAFSGSLSWLEFGHIEWDPLALFLAPVLAVVQAVHLLLLKRAQLDFFAALRAHHGNGCECNADEDGIAEEAFERFALCYVAAAIPVLAAPALYSFAHSQAVADASWESIDYVLMGMSALFMAGFKLSELWLQCRFEPHHFCALEHSKFFLASIGQWFLQNMAHATVFAALGKALFVVSAMRYWTRLGELGNGGEGWWARGGGAKQKCGPKSSLAG